MSKKILDIIEEGIDFINYTKGIKSKRLRKRLSSIYIKIKFKKPEKDKKNNTKNKKISIDR